MRFPGKKKTVSVVEHHLPPLKEYILNTTEACRRAQQERIAKEAAERPAGEAERRRQQEARSDICYSMRDTSDDSGVKYFRHSVRNYQSWEKSQRSYISFSGMVKSFLESRHLKNREFYRRAGIDRKLFSKLYNDFSYRPSKNTAIRCCLALHLEETDAINLLKSAGFAFSDNSPFDLAIRYCIVHGVYEITEVNGLLSALEITTL